MGWTTMGAAPLSVGIVGGGASGALTAARLLRDASTAVSVTVFEPRERLAEGVAYSTTDPLHLLNVPACGMSALPEDVDHFRRWVGCSDTDFVPRTTYGDYLRALLAEAAAQAPIGSSLTHVRDRVADLTTGDRLSITVPSGEADSFDAVVLATGNDAPAVPSPLKALPDDRIIRDPWQSGALDAVAPGERILIVGTGLTFVDVSLALAARVPGVRIEGVSRHGLLPQAHEDPWRPRAETPEWDAENVTLSELLAYARGLGRDWRRGLDALRPITNDLWQHMAFEDRQRFVQHLSRFWDVHRHRMAPGVARILGRMMAAGRIRVSGASVESSVVHSRGVSVTLSDGRVLVVDRVIACTGPTGRLDRDPLGQVLLSRRRVQSGPLGLGYLVDGSSGELLDEHSAAIPSVLTVGPPRRGVLWETTAMPEIRTQAASVSRRILDRQPVHV
jgi:uncharacterized NAD(P)/FAD-binding protein YdhS